MKALFAVTTAALICASTAFAGDNDKDYTFKDKGRFTATGNLTVTAGAVSLPCTAVLEGTTRGHAEITRASFSGASCLALRGSNFPWRMHANARHGFTFKDVTVSATVLGICGPGRVKAQLNTAGVIAISGAGLPGLVPCSVAGSFTTSPKLEIIPQKK